MNKKIFLIAFVFSAGIVTIIARAFPASGQSDAPVLRLHRGTLNALASEATANAQSLMTAAPGTYAIIQFRNPITLSDRMNLQQTGVIILEYLPDFAYLVCGTNNQLDAAAAIPRVYARVPFTLADKLAPALLNSMNQSQGALGRVQISGWPGDEVALARQLAALPFDITGPLDQKQFLQIARLTAVRWIEPLRQPRLLNDHARAIMGVNTIWQNVPLFGSGQIIAIADSGLDTGDEATLSADFAGRVVAAYALAPGGDWADQQRARHARGRFGRRRWRAIGC